MEEWKMAKYSLTAKIDEATVENFNKLGQTVIIVKETAGSSIDVAWISFSPFEINEVSWEETYGLYASTSDISGKARISKASYTEASEKQSYVFENGIFQPPVTDASLQGNTYEIANNVSEKAMLTFGLAQNIIANGVNYEGHPINAVQVMAHESATFTPHEKIRVFMEADIDDGMVISRIKGKTLELDFTDQTDITIKYDPAVGGFVKA